MRCCLNYFIFCSFLISIHLLGFFFYLKPGFHLIVRIVPIAPIVSKMFWSDPDDRHDRGDFGFHIIASIVWKTDTARFGPGEATLFWRESCKTKRKVSKAIYCLRYCFLLIKNCMHNEQMKYGVRWESCICLERSAERALNLGITV